MSRWEGAPPWADDEIPLTPRQVEILECLAQGLDSGATARELGISTYTVRNHVVQIFDRLGLKRRCRIAALIQAWRRGEIVLFATNNNQRRESHEKAIG